MLIEGLRKLNSNLFVPDPDNFPHLVQGAGVVGLWLGYPANNTCKRIATFPAAMVPEFTQIDQYGRVIAMGWRAIFAKAIRAGVVTKRAVERQFRVNLDYDGVDNVCPSCRKSGQIVKTDGGKLGLCSEHQQAKDNAARAAEFEKELKWAASS